MPKPGRPDTAEIAVLVSAAAGGCRMSFDRLVERYWPTAVGLARTQTQDSAQAQDIAQESFLVAYGRLRELRDPSRFIGWLTQIVLTQSRNYQRWRRVRTTLPLQEAVTQPAPTPPTNPALSQDQRAAVIRAVQRLPVKYRRIVILRFVTGLSAAEVARQLGEKPGTVRAWLHRAYEKLRPQLADLAHEVMMP
ncbi:MAG TPA: sigma-70 family RNA polymerase sigma factor [Tepidisphaeraceae bacterium]|nr:sigma-70 family RNA polymerase sigma factor [Tepidisphaeraceae bacterium]